MIAALQILFPVGSASSEPVCDIAEQKKQAIYRTLCGQRAPEAHYRFSGPSCFENSVRKRLQDTAIQVHAYRMCGDVEFSVRVKEANLNTIKFMETLSICTPERVILRQILNEALVEVESRARGISCSQELRKKIRERREFFQRMIALSNDPRVHATIYEKLGIIVDEAANIRER